MTTFKPLIIHIVCWVAYVLLYSVLWSDPGSGIVDNIGKHLSLLPVKLILVYTCIFYLIPRYLNNEKVFVFVLLLIVLIMLCVALHMLYLSSILRPRVSIFNVNGTSLDWKYISKQATFLNSPLFFALGIVMTRHWYLEKSANTQMKEAKLQMELQILKSQLQPHFFFNTLNNLYSLAVRKSDDAPVAILKLADMMRYLTYQQDTARVKLADEIDYLKNYAALEKLRSGDIVSVFFDEKNTDSRRIFIPPLLLAPFLENAFKHGADPVISCTITVYLEVKDDFLLYRVINTKRHEPNGTDLHVAGGVGLRNLEKRLAILFRSDFELTITDNVDFMASLKIPISYGNS